MSPELEDVEFVPPPEAPVFEPTEEEFKDPLAYIAKIRPYAEKTGICKIRPPPDWQPSFSVEVENFRFTPRIQRLNELEAKSRVKLNFLDHIAKFWELQGSTLRLPNVEKKPLDLYLLHKTVQEEGGFEDVTRRRKWSRVAQKMGYTQGKNYAMLRNHYEKVLFPYDVFLSGAMTGVDSAKNKANAKGLKAQEDEDDEDYCPPDSVNGNLMDPNCTRNTRNNFSEDGVAEKDQEFSSTPELKKLQFLAPGPKWNRRIKAENKDIKTEVPLHPQSWQTKDRPKSNIKEVRELTRRKPGKTTKDKSAPYFSQFNWDDYTCQVCDRGDDEESMLLCDECDSSYHTFCLIPPLNSVPPGDWRCPKCVAQACQQPHQAYGFEQAKKEYTLREFGVMADKFKEDYFGIPPHEVPPELVEKEFWRLVNSLDDEVVVEYGADLHTAEHGSGFPTKENSDDPDDEDYIKSWWNLNNLPVHEKSVLKFINADISGMKVPWLYIGMCFSSFCWHNEDHWSYSINYLHWGEPKTWYGVPGDEAELFEKCMKEAAPELFEAQPDLLHHLVTIISPTALMNAGVQVVRTNQYAGEFVITFPRAYHAGFNQGYNCAEAVNFAPSDWLPIGRKCIDHYRTMKRCPVFSHEELICKMAADPEYLDLELAKAVFLDMEAIVKEEIELRIALKKHGVKENDREIFELVPDDERQCCFCKTTCFLSSSSCRCNPADLACLRHLPVLCSCPSEKKEIRYRYTLEELPTMLNKLKKRADSFDNWCRDVDNALKAEADDKKDLSELKDLLSEADLNQFPGCDLLDELKAGVVEAEQCAQVATQLFIKKHKTRQVSSSSQQQTPKLTLEELKDFISQVQSLPCTIKEARLIQGLMSQVENFQFEAKVIVSEGCYDIDRLNELIDHANSLEIDLPEVVELKQDLKAAKWLEKVRGAMHSDELVPLSTVRSLVEQGAHITVKKGIEQPMEDLKELLLASDKLEEKAKFCLQAKPRHVISTLEVIVADASKVNTLLPNVNALKETLKKAKDWSEKVEKIQSNEYYPYYDVLEALCMRGRPIPVRLEQLPHLESQVAAAKAWKDRTVRTFVKKGSSKTLFELLAPRRDIGEYKTLSKPKKKKDKDEKDKDKKERDREREQRLESINLENYTAPNPSFLRKQFQIDEAAELEAIKKLRDENMQRVKEEQADAPYCSCRKPLEGLMIRCSLCHEWFHASCVSLPKASNSKNQGKGCTSVAVSNEVRFLCPFCNRSRRPRLDTILSLLVSLQKLPVRMPEGEALRFLTERAMNWQERVKSRLADSAIRNLLIELSSSAALLQDRRDDDITKDIADPRSSNEPMTARSDSAAASVARDNEKSNSSPSTLLITDVRTSVIADRGEEGGARTDPANLTKPDASVRVTFNSLSETNTKLEDIRQIAPRSYHEPSSKSSRLISDGEETGGLLDLECDEQMTDSPKSSVGNKDAQLESSPSEVRHSSQLLEEASRVKTTAAVIAKEGSKSKESNKVSCDRNKIRLSVELLDEIQMLLMEGDLLEITLDETQKLWHILQNQRPLLAEECKVLDSDYRRNLMKEKKKRKRRVDGRTCKDSKELLPAPSLATDCTRVGKEKSQRNGDFSKAKKSRIDTGNPKKKTEEDLGRIDDEDMDESADYDEDCSAKPCKQPLGDEVGWVQCDLCSKWYHVVCVGITAAEADAMETYSCPYCVRKEKRRQKHRDTGRKTEQEEPDAQPNEPQMNATKDEATNETKTEDKDKMDTDSIDIMSVNTQETGDDAQETSVGATLLTANYDIPAQVENSCDSSRHQERLDDAAEDSTTSTRNLFDNLLSDEDGSDDVKNVLLIDEVESCSESMEVDSAAETEDS